MTRDYKGTFEAHITVNAENLAQQAKFRWLCQDLGVKCVMIELPQGVVRSQPMTASYHQGTIKNVLLDVEKLAQQFIAEGFVITRIKIEAMVHNQDVPISDAEAQLLPKTNYFEFHVKVTLPADFNLAVLRKFCAQYNAHLSANACKQQVNGQQQRFITMRLYGVGRCAAQASFDDLLVALKSAGFKLSQPQKEYTVYDSNLNLDSGWFSTEKSGGDD